MELRREWRLWGMPVDPMPESLTERDCGWSVQWRCAHCGAEYAEMRCFKSEQLQPFRFVSGCCLDCRHKGHRYDVPGSLERLELIRWNIPDAVLKYQLSVELAFLDHPEHPHNKEYS